MKIAMQVVLWMALAAHVSAARLQQLATEPRFEVVSIKRNVSDSIKSDWVDLPDGGFRATNIEVRLLVARAYPPAIPAELVGLPDWTRTERYDVTATSSLTRATSEDRVAMLRAMLTERFNLKARVEDRDQDVFKLVLARDDRKLGSGLTPTEINCEQQREAEREISPAERPKPQRGGPAPRCTLRIVSGHIEGDGTMADLGQMLRPFVGRRVVDSTGLAGFYRVNTKFDGVLGPPNVAAPANARSVFTAVQEDLGLKLQATRAPMPTIVIDRIERPSPN